MRRTALDRDSTATAVCRPWRSRPTARWLDAELSIARPHVTIPVGRRAMYRFVGRLPLEQVIGREHEIRIGSREVKIIPLPHPSGASSWVHGAGHAELLSGALGLLRARLAETLYL